MQCELSAVWPDSDTECFIAGEWRAVFFRDFHLHTKLSRMLVSQSVLRFHDVRECVVCCSWNGRES